MKYKQEYINRLKHWSKRIKYVSIKRKILFFFFPMHEHIDFDENIIIRYKLFRGVRYVYEIRGYIK